MSQAEINRRVADHAKNVLSIDEETGNIAGGAELFNDPVFLPEGTSAEDMAAADKLVKHRDTTFIAGVTRAVTEMAQEKFGAGETKYETVTGSFGMYGKDNMTVSAHRDGNVDLTVTNRAADTSVGQLKAAAKDFKAAMAAAKAE